MAQLELFEVVFTRNQKRSISILNSIMPYLFRRNLQNFWTLLFVVVGRIYNCSLHYYLIGRDRS
jgi:hypothetical protein